MADDDKLNVKVQSLFTVYYDGQAESVSAVNKTGPFDVLYEHANFFSLLTAGTIVIRNDGEQFKVQVNQGMMQVSNNEVKVFVNI